MHPHFSADVRQNLHIAFVEFHSKNSVRQILYHATFKLNALFLIRVVLSRPMLKTSSTHLCLFSPNPIVAVLGVFNASPTTFGLAKM